VDVRLLLILIAEKFGLVATAALVCVLVPPLRNRLLGVGGKPRDRLAVFLLGFLLTMWGAKMGESWMGVLVNVHGIGILISAVLGGTRVGFFTGVLGGLFLTFRVDPTLGWVGVAASTIDGTLAGWLAEKRPIAFQGNRTLLTASVLQIVRFGFVAIVLAVIAIIVVVQNREDVTLTLLVIEVTMPLWVASLVLLLIGTLVGWLLSSRRRRAKAG